MRKSSKKTNVFAVPYLDEKEKRKNDPAIKLRVARCATNKKERKRIVAEDFDPSGLDFSQLRHVDAALAEKARRNFRTFLEQGWHVLHPARPFIPNWHIDAICEHLQALHKLEIRKLLITVPPGMAKSMLMSVYLPAWVWLDDPTLTFVYLSFAHELAGRDSKRCRNLIKSNWYQKHFGHLFKLTETKELMLVNDKTGFRAATSVKGAGGHGERGDYLMGDDPITITKGRHVSGVERKEANRAWVQQVGTRVRESSTVRMGIIMQRIHDDDVAGQVLRQGDWTWLNLPMEYVPTKQCVTSIGWKDPRTYDGELLFPRMFDRKFCEDKKRPDDIGEYAYSAFYQQDPIPEGGGIIKLAWIESNQYSESPIDIYAKAGRVIQSWDTAQKVGPGRSFTVGQLWCKIGALLYLVDEFREQVEIPDILRAIKRMKTMWPKTQEILVEDKSSGTDVVAMLKDQIQGIVPVPVNNEGSKDDRLYAVSYLFEAGNIKIPKAKVDNRNPPSISWVPIYIDELIRAPAGRMRDQCDSTSQALKRLASQGANPNAIPIGVGEGRGFIRSWDGLVAKTMDLL